MEWLLYVLLAVVCASTREILQKRALQGEKTLEYLVIRGFFIAILALFMLPFINLEILKPGILLMCLIVAVLGATAIYYRNTALKNIAVSHVQPLMNIGPLFVLLIAYLFLGETVDVMQLYGILLIVFGTYVLEVDHEHQGILGPFKHLAESPHALMVVFAVFIFAITNTLDRFLLVNYVDAITYAFTVWIMGSIIFFLFHYFEYGIGNILKVFKEQGARIFPPAALTLLLFIFFYKSMSIAPAASLVAAVFRLESIVATIEGGIFFHEKHLHKKAIACLIMTFGAILVVI